MIKVIALDLDGTLLTDDKKVTPENKKAIQLAKEQGVKIVLCTGRPLMSIYHLLEELELLGLWLFLKKKPYHRDIASPFIVVR